MNRYPAISDLEKAAQKRIPKVAWAYLQTGTGSEQAIHRNTAELAKIALLPRFLKGEIKPELSIDLFGDTYAFPFGIAPVGLTGLMWPKAEIYLAETAQKYQIPFCLSTVATQTPETVGPKVGNMGWFQLYPPRQKALRSDLLKRAKNAGFRTLVVTADVPTPSRRERTKRAGLSTPAKLNPRFLWQGMMRPAWSLATLRNGLPSLKTIEAYSKSAKMSSVDNFVRHSFRVNPSWEYLAELRAEWDGPLILKGILHPADAEKAIQYGCDAIVVSNHGGRQFDGAPASIEALPAIAQQVNGRCKVLFDSGIRTGLDIIRAIHFGADFVLLGRAFLYGVCALGKEGGNHVVDILIDELNNNMSQLGITKLEELKS